MPEAGPILDYASPRRRGKLRLPARSRIWWHVDEQSRAVTITESLGGKQEAFFALLFAAFIVVVLGFGAFDQASRLRKHPGEWPMTALLCGLWLAEVIVMILVIDQTWRKTIIRATFDQFTFRSRSPLRRRTMAWHAREVADVRLGRTQDAPDAAQLGEIEIMIVDQPGLKLFTDHLYKDLESVAQAILYGLGRLDSPPAVDPSPRFNVPPGPIIPPPRVPDDQTFDRLVDRHREMRERHPHA
jgi:hypothetical protein